MQYLFPNKHLSHVDSIIIKLAISRYGTYLSVIIDNKCNLLVHCLIN